MPGNATADAAATAARSLLIGQLARATGFGARAIRYYETLGLVKPHGRTESGYRMYAPEAVVRLRLVRGARDLGLGLRDIRAILDASDSGEVTREHVLATVDREIARASERIRGLRELRGRLQGVRTRVAEALRSGLALIDALSNIRP